jgi:hypothetical protein
MTCRKKLAKLEFLLRSANRKSIATTQGTFADPEADSVTIRAIAHLAIA